MKILHISHEDHGGAGAAAYRLHLGLRELGVDSRFLTAASIHNEPHVIMAGACVESLRLGSRTLRRVPEFANAPAAWRKLVENYPQRRKNLEMFSSPIGVIPDIQSFIPHNTDILHFHWICGMIPMQAACPWLAAVPIVWTLHDMNPFTGGCHYSFGCEKYRQQCGDCFQLNSGRELDASRRIFNQKRQACDSLEITCVSPSHWMQQHALASSLLGKKRHVVIPNPVDARVYRPFQDTRSRFGWHQQDRTTLLFGSASGGERKGFSLLLAALRQLASQECERFSLIIVGTPPSGELLELKVPVHPLGYIYDPEEMARIYSAVDALVVPSLEDNLPGMVSECLLCGTPVVAFRQGGIEEQLQHGRTGYLATPGDTADLAAGLRWIARHPAGDVSRICRQQALARFDVARVAEEMMQLYQRTLAGSVRP